MNAATMIATLLSLLIATAQPIDGFHHKLLLYASYL